MMVKWINDKYWTSIGKILRNKLQTIKNVDHVIEKIHLGLFIDKSDLVIFNRCEGPKKGQKRFKKECSDP